MKAASHIGDETRSETIFRHTQRMLHERRISMPTFAQDVVQLYHERTAVEARELEFKTDGDPFRVWATNAQKLHRFMERDVAARMPVDIEEAWVLALQEPYRAACRADLARRMGALDVPLPTCSGASDLQSVSRLTTEMGEFLQRVAPALDDGAFGAEDARHMPGVIQELEALISVASGVRARCQAVLGQPP